MPALPGRSLGFLGGGDQPPNKRSKMQTGNPSNPESDQEDSTQPGSGSSVMGVKKEHLQCPVCQEYPPMEVFQCDEGHISCHACIAKMTRCPVCRANYNHKKIRNRVAEIELDDMKFKCRFRSSGCLKTNIHRNQRTSHEIQCEHNPSPPGFKLCCLFENSSVCQFRIDPDTLIQDPEHTKDVIEHLTGPPHNLPHKKVQIGEKTTVPFFLTSVLDPCFVPIQLFEVISCVSRKTTGYYVLIQRVGMPNRKNFSWAVVGLNSANVDINDGNRHSDKIPVKLSIQGKPDRNNFGNDCGPNLSWSMKSTYLDEWEELMKIQIEKRPQFSFTIPRNFLSEYFEKEDGKYELSLSFGH